MQFVNESIPKEQKEAALHSEDIVKAWQDIEPVGGEFLYQLLLLSWQKGDNKFKKDLEDACEDLLAASKK